MVGEQEPFGREIAADGKEAVFPGHLRGREAD